MRQRPLGGLGDVGIDRPHRAPRSTPARRKIEQIRAWAYCRYGAVLPSNDSIRSQSKM